MKIRVIRVDMLDSAVGGVQLNDEYDVVRIDPDGFYIVNAPAFDEYPLHEKQVEEI